MQSKSLNFFRLQSFLTLLLLTISLVYAAPAPPSNILIQRSSSNATRTVQKREWAVIDEEYEGGVVWSGCISKHEDPNMCGVSYAWNSNWGNFVRLGMYDHNCIKIGYNQAVPRSDLAWGGDPGGKIFGFGFDSELPHPLYVFVNENWNTNAIVRNKDAQMGVGFQYNGVVSTPLLDNQWKLAEYKHQYYNDEGGMGVYVFFRGQFRC